MFKIIKKYVAILLIVSMALNMFACDKISTKIETTAQNDVLENKSNETDDIKNVEGKYPIHWDLTQIYKNIDEWENDYNKLDAFVSTISELQGTINDVNGIYKYIMLNMEGEVPIIMNKLDYYVHLSKDLNTTNSTFLNLQSKYDNLVTKYQKATSFFEEEMRSIPIDNLNQLFEDEKLKPYKYYYSDYFIEGRPKYSRETLNAIIQATSNYGGEENTFDALQYGDLKKPKIKMPNGEIKDLDNQLFDEITYGNYSRELKAEADNLHLGESKDYINTLTSMLYNHMKEVHNEVLLDNGNEVLAHELENKNIDRDIYDNIVECTHKLLPELQRFIKIKKDLLKIDDMYYIDFIGSYATYDAKTSYDDAVDKVRNALKILGDEYITKYDEMVTNGHIDVYPDKNKVTGGYEASLSNKNIKPYVLLNFTGFIEEVKTLAHELGHTMFSIFSEENVKNIPNMDAGIFLHEITSTFNENIFTRYMIDNAESDEEKLYFIEDKINDINGTLIRQILYSEFEDYLYKKIENGENFEATELCDKWMELHKTYYGDDIDFQDGMKYRWASIPHFYYVYYVYKYATSLTYSSILAKEVYENKEGAREKYLDFLKGGESEKPAEILNKLGINPSDKSIYNEFLEYYKSLIDEFESLAK